MSRMISRRFFLGSAAALLATRGGAAETAAQAPEASLRPVLRGTDHYKQAIPSVAEILKGQNLTGKVSFAVADARTGLRLEEEGAQEGRPPASVAKALTALYALDALGPEHRFETRLLATGRIVDGEVQGDLVLVGGGDPTLDTDGLADLAEQLKTAGIHGVKGGLKVYQADFPVQAQIDPEQPDHVGYNPGVSALALNYNRVHFEWKRASSGYDVTMEGRSARHRPSVSMASMEVVDRRGPVYTYHDGGQREDWTVARTALGTGGARWLPVRKPGLYAADVFATLAGSQGIRLRDHEIVQTRPEGEVVATLQSDGLTSILRDMLKYSTNLTAEMVGLAATGKRIGKVESLRASAAEMNRWAIAELGLTAPKLVDHSGLGDDSLLSAADMTRALIAAQGAGLRPILKKVALRDAKGRPQPDHPIQIVAKTGTLNFVSGLAGYLTAEDGTDMVFAIFAADIEERNKIPREAREGPPGARAWNGRAKRVQYALLARWGALYGS
ncbi:D-alanyl-D-alanine carboxypeptidase/D-alanyl-D-alanine-endopeptidase [Sulfitobacter aestuarii]|uniref:D-alanyl-D-alanine carboxypeptidase/D-alanyl-D-alanine-endopeptidase n=1 Tax=Sulfitobacter aestuarii TaxID=2161676 RepID=A0ABW5U5N4_9RHOB